MTTLEYYFSNDDHVMFDKYSIDTDGIITNINTCAEVVQHLNNGYKSVNVTDNNGILRRIRVARAIASTFLGKPLKGQTADHIDQNSLNDTLENIKWASKSEQRKNQTRPTKYSSAFIIVKNNIIEKTANEWVEYLKDELSPYGNPYTKDVLLQYARKQIHGFRYKVFEDLPGEEWKVIEGSQNKKNSTWYVSSEGRMKYKTQFAENVLTADQLTKIEGYPAVRFAGKIWLCHVVAFKTFFPAEYATKLDNEIVRHLKDNRLDFRPKMLNLGSPSQNRTDAYNNGKYDSANKARKPVASYINDEFERNHESLMSAAEYLRNNGHLLANTTCIRAGLDNNSVRYGRTWKRITI